MAELTLPINPFQITQVFGVNAAAYARFGLAGHNGWDVRTKYDDTPAGRRYILATQDSNFFKKGNEGNDGFGLYFEVITRTSKGYWKHTFAHCASIETFIVKKRAENMAISDNTGNSTGPHLHWTTKRVQKNADGTYTVLNYNNGYFGAINPQIYVDEVRNDVTSSPPPGTTPPMNDKRAYWFDLMNKAIWGGKPWESLTQPEIDKFVSEYPGQYKRSGLWDHLGIKAGLTGASNDWTVDQLYQKIASAGTDCTQKVQEALNAYKAKIKAEIDSLLG